MVESSGEVAKAGTSWTILTNFSEISPVRNENCQTKIRGKRVIASVLANFYTSNMFLILPFYSLKDKDLPLRYLASSFLSKDGNLNLMH